MILQKLFHSFVEHSLLFLLINIGHLKKYTINFKEILRFMVLYSATLGANVASNKYMLSMTGLIFFAFLFATGVSTVLNFTGQKFWVFR